MGKSSISCDAKLLLALVDGPKEKGELRKMLVKGMIFSVNEAELDGSLDRGSIPKDLKNRFEREDQGLSESASLSVKEDGEKWVISDGNHVYTIKSEGGKLNVYEGKGYDGEFSDATFYRKFNELERRDEIVELKDGRYALRSFERGVEDKVLSYLEAWGERYPDLEVAPPAKEVARGAGISTLDSETLEKVRERILKEGYRPSPPITPEARKDHTSELKQVIGKWIDVLEEDPLDGGKTEKIEGLHLFTDLEFHLHSNVFQQWEKFKKLAGEYRTLRRKLESKIRDKIEEIGREKPFFLPPGREIESEGEKLLEISVDDLKRKEFDLTEKIRRRVESGNAGGKGASPSSDDRVTGRMVGDLDPSTDWEDTDKEREKRIDLYRRTVREVIEEEADETERVSELYGDLNAMKGRITGELKRHLSIPSFSGCCQYLAGELSGQDPEAKPADLRLS